MKKTLACLSTNSRTISTKACHLPGTPAVARLAQEVAGVGTWEWDPEQDSFVWSPEHYALFGLSPMAGEPDSLEAFLALVHPEDRDAVRAAAHEALESGEYLAEFRILRPGRNGGEETLWLIGRGRRMPSPAGRVGPILGVNVDITARKEAEQRQQLLMREVDHRAKNALAVVQAVLRLTRAESMPAFAKAVEGRVAALAREQADFTAARPIQSDNLAATNTGTFAARVVASTGTDLASCAVAGFGVVNLRVAHALAVLGPRGAGRIDPGAGVLYALLVRKERAAGNPWGEGATTLEWTLSSPPPFHQFNELPVIKPEKHH